MGGRLLLDHLDAYVKRQCLAMPVDVDPTVRIIEATRNPQSCAAMQNGILVTRAAAHD